MLWFIEQLGVERGLDLANHFALFLRRWTQGVGAVNNRGIEAALNMLLAETTRKADSHATTVGGTIGAGGAIAQRVR